METSLISISKIFTERLLRIPDYQRGYAWTSKEISEFWNDVIFLENDKNHYVGVLTLEDVPEKNISNWVEDHWIIQAKNYSPYFIVDGQQRITTIVILIQAIIEEMNSRGSEQQLNYTDISDIRKKFIFENKEKKSPLRSYIFGYDKDNPSYEYLKQEIFGEHSVSSLKLENTIYTQNLLYAKKFFAEKIHALPLNEMESIYKKITQNLLFNIYSLDKEIDTYVAFETMNNRGKILSHLELLKNRLIYLTTKLSEPDYEKDSLRHSINECWKSMYHFLGKDIKKRLSDDEFLYHHYVLHFKQPLIESNDDDTISLEDEEIYFSLNRGYSITRDEHTRILLDEIFSSKPLNDKTRTFEITAEFISNYVSSLKKSVETWYFIHNPEESRYSKKTIEWLTRITKIPTWKVCRVLLLELLNNGYSTQSIENTLGLCERLLFINTMFLNRYFFKELNLINLALHFRREKNIDWLMHYLKTETDKTLKYVHREFSEKFKESDFYHWSGIRYFMYDYEYSLQLNSKTERTKLNWEEFRNKERDSDYDTIEHIYPQRAQHSSWKELFKDYSIRERKRFRHSIGNLVPLASRKNSSLSNKSFAEKSIKGFKYGCYSENELTNYSQWGPEDIKERSFQLLAFMDKRWDLGLCPQQILKDKDKNKAKTFYLNLIGLNI